MKKKQITPPSFEDRLDSAFALADAATTSFELVALDLEEAATQKREVANDISVEIDRLLGLVEHLSVLKAEAEEFEAKSLAKADKIRALVSA